MFSLNFKNAMPLAIMAMSGVISFSTHAEAVTANYTSNLSCDVVDVTGGGSNSSDCFGTVSGNPSQIGESAFETATFVGYFSDNSLSTTGLFGKTDWNLIAKKDFDPVQIDGLNGTEGTTPTTGSEPGTWSLIDATALSAYGYSAVMLKQGSFFAAYLFDGAPLPTSGEWYTAWWTNNPGDVSNITVWAGGKSVNGQIPVPAGLPLLLTAMGLGGFMSWRKRKTV
ncbi:hypothetical protein RAZWK3B_00875 [Roseobacter sp. AzwK-3b]|uniref:hypothetical protein n=1 Tax=Roseobacter sp. AzwK-3b TaxID=351016 RepID=UPI00015696AD|nr:hypothetical protein [Roseobacter sp. AzwK-3b]EDM72729.1 hypothetical protein RAZWK3B_00875 [Roseobacter sp. AzwK-3b]